jgi:hypothetical protein
MSRPPSRSRGARGRLAEGRFAGISQKIGRYFCGVNPAGSSSRGARLFFFAFDWGIDGKRVEFDFWCSIGAIPELIGPSVVSANPDKKALCEVCKKKFQRNLEIERGGRD